MLAIELNTMSSALRSLVLDNRRGVEGEYNIRIIIALEAKYEKCIKEA